MSEIRLEGLGDRRFSFQPPMGNVAENQWILRREEWSEILVYNPAGAFEVWVPKAFLAGCSEDPAAGPVLNLAKEIFYQGGSVWPTPRRHIEMPPAPAAAPETAGTGAAAAAPLPESMGRAGGAESRMVKMVGIAIGASVAIVLLIFGWFQLANSRQSVTISARDQTYLALSRDDDYFAVIQLMGRPTDDRWQSATAGVTLRAMAYPDRGFTIMLMGPTHDSAKYIGTVDDKWRPLHWIKLHSGDSRALLSGMRRF